MSPLLLFAQHEISRILDPIFLIIQIQAVLYWSWDVIIQILPGLYFCLCVTIIDINDESSLPNCTVYDFTNFRFTYFFIDRIFFRILLGFRFWGQNKLKHIHSNLHVILDILGCTALGLDTVQDFLIKLGIKPRIGNKDYLTR